MPDPLKASFPGQGDPNWRKDNAGVMLPLGGSSSAKMLMELPKETRGIAIAANTLARGKFSKELWPKLALLSTIAGPDHEKTNQLIVNITAGSMAEGGQASINYLQGITGMLVSSALPVAEGHPQYKKASRNNGKNDGKVTDDEQ